MVQSCLKIIIVLIISVIVYGSSAEAFPKIMWVYWQQGYEQASAFTKICIQNKQRIAEENHWKFNLLSKHNLQEYLDIQEIQDINSIMAAANLKLVQIRVDLIRMMLLYKYGGMWMDANTFFFRDLAWVDNPAKQKYIYNKIGDYPDVILGAYSVSTHGGNKTYIFDTKYNITVNIFPGIENWFILSKPKSQFLKDCLSTIRHIIMEIGQRQATLQYEAQNIIFPLQYLNPYFIASDYLFQVILQKKQKQIQAKSNQTQNIKYAVEYYKLWNFQADETTFRLSLFYEQKTHPLFFDAIKYQMQQYYPEVSEYPYFIKLAGWKPPQFNYFMQNYIEFNCWGFHYQIEGGSIWDRYLMKDSTGVEVVEKIKKWNKDVQEGKAICESREEDNKANWMIDIYGLSIMGVYFLIFCCFFRGFSQQTSEQRKCMVSYQQIALNQKSEDNIHH